MMREAESHSAEDVKKREEIEARNRLDGLTYQVEKTFNENRAKVDGAGASELEAAIADAKKAAEEGGADRMNDAFNRLQTASHKLAEALYQQSGTADAGGSTGTQGAAAGASTGSASQGTNEDNVIDAEYVDVDDKK